MNCFRQKLIASARPWLLCCILMGFAPFFVNGQLTGFGTEIKLNNTTANAQRNPASSINDSENHVVVWQSWGQDGDGWGIYAIAVANRSATPSAEILINTAVTTGSQLNPDVAMSSDGDYVVVWQDESADGDGWGIYYGMFNLAGSALQVNTLVNGTTTGNQRLPAVAVAGNDTYVLVWESEGHIFGRLINVDGTLNGGEFQISTTMAGSRHSYPSVAMDNSGGFVVTWQAVNTSGESVILAQRMSSAAVAQGGIFTVNSELTTAKTSPSIDMNSSGEFAIAWSSYGQDGDNLGVYARKYGSDGVSQISEFKVNTDDTSGAQTQVDVKLSPSGVMLFTYTNYAKDGDKAGVYSEAFKPDGTRSGTPIQISTTTADNQMNPSVAFVEETDPVFVVWQDGLFGSSTSRDGSDYGIYRGGFILADIVDPVAEVQDINLYLDNTGNGSIVAADVDNGSSDNVGITSMTVDKSAFTCADIGENTLVFTIEDAAGNSVTAGPKVTVIDTISPAPTVQNITAYLNGAGTLSVTAADFDNGSTDNCGIASLAIDKTDFTCSDVGVNSLTFTVTDNSGNSKTAGTQLTVLDTISPSVVTQNITRYLDETGVINITANDIDNGSSDNCSISSLVLDKTSFTNSDLGANSVTLTVTDASGNSKTAVATLTILKSTGTIALSNLSHTYNSMSPTVSAVPTPSGLTVDLTYLGINGTVYPVSSIAPVNVGEYTVTATINDANYEGSNTGTLIINARALTVTADPKSKTYGDADPALTYQLTSGALQGSDALSGGLSRATGENVGSYSIVQGTLDAGNNYSITYVADNLTIGTRALTIKADAKSKTYGDADPSLTSQITSGALQFSDALSGSLTRVAGENVGTYAINVGTLSAGSNYDVTYVSDNLTIGTRAITVTADAKIKTYGDVDPALTYQLTTGVLQGADAFSGSLTRDAGDNVGTYSITQGTLDAGSNYSLTYVSADLTIGARAITITADAKSKTYGDSDPSLTYQITSGALQGGDVLSGSISRVAGENVGTYAINQNTLDAGSNYSVTYVSDNLTVSTRALTITADAKSKTYGDSDPALTYQITSGALQFSDALSGSLTRVAGEDAGTYAINVGTLNAGSNYDVTYVGDNLTIGSRSITVTVDAVSKTFGDADPAFTYSVSGTLQFSDSFSGALSRAAGEDAGTYAINQGTLSLPASYSITFNGENLTINKATQTITFAPIAINLAEGNTLTLSATGGASGNPVVFSSSDPSIASVSGNVVTVNLEGPVFINADQAGNTNYEEATTVMNLLAISEVYIWNGAIWNSGSTPPVNKSIIFEGSYTLSGSMEAFNVLVDPGVTLTLQAGASLVMNSDIDAIGGTVIVESGASLVTYGAITGTDYRVERTTTFDQSTGRYSVVGTPITNADFSTLGASALIYGYDQSELYNPSGNEGLDRFKTPATLGITELGVGRGYFSAFTGDVSGTVNFIGTPNTGNIDVALDFTDHAAAEETDFEGFNLISNPYPSAIGYSSFMTTNSAADINGSIYLWDDFDSQTGRGTNSDYLIVNSLGNTDSRSNGEAKWDGNIRSGQGFFVKANSATTVSFNNSMRVTGNNSDGGFYRVDEAETKSLKLKLSNASIAKAIIVGFAPDATIEMDAQYDAPSWSADEFSFYSIMEGRQLAIQGLPQYFSGEIALGMNLFEEGQQTISLMDQEELEGMDVVFLKDKLTGEVINLREQSYTFTANAGETNDRFVLQAFPSNVTDVENNLDLQVFSYTDQSNLYVVFKTNEIKEAHFKMFDLSGRMMLSERSEINANRWQVATDKIPTNMYLLIVQTEKGIWKQKVKVE